MPLLGAFSVQLRHVTSKYFAVFSLNCELIVQVLEHVVLHCVYMKDQSKHYLLNTKITANNKPIK